MVKQITVMHISKWSSSIINLINFFWSLIWTYLQNIRTEWWTKHNTDLQKLETRLASKHETNKNNFNLYAIYKSVFLKIKNFTKNMSKSNSDWVPQLHINKAKVAWLTVLLDSYGCCRSSILHYKSFHMK